MFTIGCHLSSAKGYLHMAKDAVSIDANTFQFFTRNPRGGRAKAIDPKDIAAFAAYAPEHGIERILAHAPYTLNPASDKQQTRDFALMVLAEDLGRMEETPHQLYNMHPGSAVGQPCEVAIAKIADALNQSLLPHQTTTLLLETMAIHLNDSMNARGSHKDRHARIGEGEIGFKALAAVTNHPKLRDLPFYLETPNPDLAGYAEEIAALRRAHE